LTLPVLRGRVKWMEMAQKTENPCQLCGQPIKEGQGVTWEGKVVCPTCLDKKTGIHKTAHKRAKWIVAALVLVAIVCGTWLGYDQYQELKRIAFNDFDYAIYSGRPTEEAISQLPWWFGVNTKDNDGRTLLHLAAEHGKDKVARTLIEHGADKNAKEKHAQTPLHYAIKYRYNKVALVLIEHEADVNAIDNQDWTPLHYAAKLSNDKVARKLIELGVNVNAKDNSGWTPLHITVRFEHDNVTPTLIEHGADVNAKTNNGNTPLDLAKNKAIPTLLRVHGGKTGAELALQGVKRRIAENANVNPKGKNGRTLLHNAAEKGWKDVIVLLLKNGADVNAKDNNGMTPRLITVNMENYNVTQTLIEHGANVNAIDEDGETPLHYVAASGYDKVAETFIKYGADVNAIDKEDKTPLDYVSEFAPPELRQAFVTLLRKHGGKTGEELDKEAEITP